MKEPTGKPSLMKDIPSGVGWMWLVIFVGVIISILGSVFDKQITVGLASTDTTAWPIIVVAIWLFAVVVGQLIRRRRQ